MKTSITIIIALWILSFTKISAQISNHPTLDSVTVVYKIVSNQANNPIDSVSGPLINMNPEIMFDIKTATCTKVYLQILNSVDNTILYQVNYNLANMPYVNADGVSLFYQDVLTYHIVCPISLLLNTYTYKIYTEQSVGNFSSQFIINQ